MGDEIVSAASGGGPVTSVTSNIEDVICAVGRMMLTGGRIRDLVAKE
jgi:hypothetical protein